MNKNKTKISSRQQTVENFKYLGVEIAGNGKQ